MTEDGINLRVVVQLQCPGRALQAGIVALASLTGLVAALLSHLS